MIPSDKAERQVTGEHCAFCDELQKEKELCEDMRKPTSGETIHKFTAALVWESIYIYGWGEERPSGTLTSYGYALNFCPVCGRKYIND